MATDFADPGGICFFTAIDSSDLIGGRLQLALPGITAVAPLVRENRIDAIAVMSESRSEVLPDVPTTAEVGEPGLTSETWFGILSPKGTPEPVREKINTALNAALENPEFRAKLIDMGFTIMGGTQQQFVQLLDDDIKKWSEIVRTAGITIE